MKYYKYLLLTMPFFLLVSCTQKDNPPFEVTYEVRALAGVPLNIYIAYNDSTGSTVIHTTEKQWSKKVTLQPNQFASLVVKFSYDWNRVFENDPYYFLDREKRDKSMICGKIIHPKKTVQEYSESIILISLFESETKERNILSQLLFP